MYVITGATGNTGSIVTRKLLAKGHRVRVVGRDAARLEPFVQKGAERFVASLDDATPLERAFAGAHAVYALIPPNVAAEDVPGYQERVSAALAAAIERAAVPYAVALSSVGADKPDRVGPVVGLHNLEQKLNRIPGLNVLHLRAAYFMENLLAMIPLIKSMGILGGVIKGDVSVAMIATRDIGAVAAEALDRLDFSGKQTRELLGPRDVTMAEAARVIGPAIGKPGLSYSSFPTMIAKPAMVRMGLSESYAGLICEMSEAINDRYMVPLETRSPRNTTPTSIEQFVAEEFVPRFQGKATSA